MGYHIAYDSIVFAGGVVVPCSAADWGHTATSLANCLLATDGIHADQRMQTPLLISYIITALQCSGAHGSC